MKKKEIRIAIEEKKKRSKRKDKFVLVSGIIIFTFAVFQAIILMFYFSSHEQTGHNSIILGEKVVTTEVCTQWFNYLETKPRNEIPGQTFYYDDKLKKHAIPKNIVIEVCNKWKVIKDEVDANE